MKWFESKPVSQRIFSVILMGGIIVSLVLIAEIILLGYPLFHTITWIVLFAVSAGSLHYYSKNQYIETIHTIYFLILIYGLLPFGWTLSDLRSYFPIIYAFLALISICNLFSGKKRIFFVVSDILVVIVMLNIEIFRPELFPVIEERNLILDSIIQSILTFTAGALMLIAHANTLREKNNQLESLSNRDDLTGLYNRRYIYEYLKKISQERPEIKTVIGLIDIDDFKYINDQYGHIVGDRIIVAATESISKRLSKASILGRLGGDELMVIVQCKEFETCYKDIIAINASANFFNQGISIHDSVTCSGGFVIFDYSEEIETNIAKADRLMYQAKEKGKNQMVFSDEIKELIKGRVHEVDINR